MKYFEGFYVKCVGQRDSIAVIFGRQAFKKEKSYSVIFDASVKNIFKKKPFEARVDKSFADKNCLFLDVNTPELVAKGQIIFGEFSPIKYDAMGPLKFLPKMECKHSVISMRHTLKGQIELNGEFFDFDDGVGYIEGDSGSSFPQKYFWSQCNDDRIGVSLFVSAARIPYMGIRFTGTICVIHFEGNEYRFASYLGARVKQIDAKKLLIKQGKKQLEIETLDNKEGLPLMAPMAGKMTRVIEESLDRVVRYKLSVNKNVLFDFTSNRAAYEYSSMNSKFS